MKVALRKRKVGGNFTFDEAKPKTCEGSPLRMKRSNSRKSKEKLRDVELEIKKQIQEKESQLANLSSSKSILGRTSIEKSYLRNKSNEKMNKTVKFSDEQDRHTVQGVVNKASARVSPFRFTPKTTLQKDPSNQNLPQNKSSMAFKKSQQNVRQYDSANRSISPYISPKKQHSKSPRQENMTPNIRLKNQTPTRETGEKAKNLTSGVKAEYNKKVENKYKRKIEQMKIDNQGLNKRLKVIETELQNTHTSKTSLFQTLEAKIDTIQETEDLIRHEDPAKSHLYDRIEIEKRENARLHKLISDLARERDDLDYQQMKKVQQNDDCVGGKMNMHMNISMVQDQIERVIDENIGTLRQKEIIIDEQFEVNKVDDGIRIQIEQLNLQIDILQRERMALVNQIVKLTEEYHFMDRQTRQTHLDIKRQCKAQRQSIALQIISNNLKCVVHNDMQRAWNETKSFAQFDKNIKKRLKTFSMIVYKLGKYKMLKALEQWYENGLKPSQTIQLNIQLAKSTNQRRTKAMVFNGWKNMYDDQFNKYQHQDRSVTLIFNKIVNNANKERKRAMQIWRGYVLFRKQKQHKLTRLLVQRKQFVLQKSMQTWKLYSMEIDCECRQILLRREYAQKIYVTQVFRNLHYATVKSRRKRIRKLNLIFKALQDASSYNRHLISSNVQSIYFLSAQRKFNMQQYFDALKIHTETNKAIIMKKCLVEDMNKALEEHTNFNNNQNKGNRNTQLKCTSKIITSMLGKRLWAYFKHWENNSKGFKGAMNTKVKDKIYRMYSGYISSYFSHWKKNAAAKVIKKKRKMIMQMEQYSDQIINENEEEQNKNKIQVEAVRQTRQRVSNKVFKKFMIRKEEVCFNRWKKKLSEHKSGNVQNNNILNKYRLRMLQQGFTLYKEFLFEARTQSKYLKAAENIERTFLNIRKRNIFEGFVTNHEEMKKAKRYWNRILLRLDLGQKRSLLRRWRDQANLKKVCDLAKIQNQKYIELEGKNKQIGLNENYDNEIMKKTEEIETRMSDIAHRQIGNYLVRNYSGNCKTYFDKWKVANTEFKQKESIMKRTIEHYRKQQMENVKQAFSAFIKSEKTKVKHRAIKKLLIESEEQQQSVTFGQEQMEQVRAKVKEEEVKSLKVINTQSLKLEKTIDAMTRRNNQLVFASKKRAIFQNWINAVKVEKAFCVCIENVVTKSALAIGFQHLTNTSRETNRMNQQNTSLNRQFLKHHKRFIRDYFKKWKLSNSNTVELEYEHLKVENETTKQQFAVKIKSVKKQNCKNVENMFHKKRLSSLFEKWLKFADYYKTKRRQNEESVNVLKMVTQRRVLQKWKMRENASKRIKFNIKSMKLGHNQRICRAIFNQMIKQRDITKKLMKSLNNLSKVLIDKNLIIAIKTIQNYSLSKTNVQQNQRKQASIDVWNILVSNRTNLLKTYFNRYHFTASTQTKNNKIIKTILLKIDNVNLRLPFEHWIKQTRKIQLAEEMNQTGPVTEELFEANRMIKNLQQFMREEGYTEEEIAAQITQIKIKNQHLLNKGILRMRLPDDKKILITCIEHWKMWKKHRQLMMDKLRFANNSVTPVLCDIQQAFHKWKFNDAKNADFLSRFDYAEIKQLSHKQQKMLDNLSYREADNNAEIHHLNFQRDQLLDHYIRAQKLAIVILRDNQRKTMQHGLKIWIQCVWKAQTGEAANAIMERADDIGAVKKRMKVLEAANQSMREQNAMLKGQSSGKTQITKMLRKEKQQKDKIDASLQESQTQIDKMIKENERLMEQITKAEQKAGIDK